MTQKPVSIIQLRRDTKANWEANNPVLRQGEPGFDTTSGKLKIGDGTLAWISLGYVTPGTFDITAVPVVNDLLVWDGSKWVNKTATNAGVAKIDSPTFTTKITTPSITNTGFTAAGVVSNLATGVLQTTPTLSVGLGGTGNSTLASGQYLKGNGSSAITTQSGIPTSDFPAGTILQVKSVSTSAQSTTTSNVPTNIPGLSISITPRSSSSTFFLTAMVNSGFSNTTGGWTYFNFARSGTDLIFATAGTGENTFANTRFLDDGSMLPIQLEYLDSPATASAITYTVRWNVYSSNTAILNRRYVDTYFAGTSTFTVMEIAG